MSKAAKELEQVNASIRSQRAAARVNGQNGSASPLHVAEDVVSQHDTLWEQIRKFLPQPENLNVSGKQVSGFVVPHWAAAVLLAAILGCIGFVYNRLGDQRDMLIRLDTQLQERDRHDAEYRQEFKNQLNVQKVYIDNLMTQLSIIKTQQMRTPQSRKQEN